MTVDFDAFPRISYWGRVREPLFDLLKALENKIDRERREELEARARGTRSWLLGNLRVVRQSYAVVETLARDLRELSLPLETSVAIAPLARVVLESAMSVCFVFEDTATRLPWFWKATWAGLRDQLTEAQANHGSDPAWAEWIAAISTECDEWQKLLASHSTPLTPQELAGTARIRYWPNPGKMTKTCLEPTRRAMLDYLNERFYGELSAMSHLSGTGLLAQGGVLLAEQEENVQRKYFSDRFLTAMTMMFVFASVLILDVVPERSLAERAIGLWTTPNLWGSAMELFRIHFEQPLLRLK